MKFVIRCLFLLLIHTTASMAQLITCNTQNIFNVETVTLAGSISVGEDTPVGTVIYKAIYSSPKGRSTSMFCDTTHWKDSNPPITGFVRSQIISMPYPVVPGILGPYNANVYYTNISGVGVSVIPFEGKEYYRPWAPGIISSSTTSSVHSYEFYLVKIGKISPGLLDGSLVPSYQTSINSPDPIAGIEFLGFPVTYYELKYSGQIQIVTSTCDIIAPNFSVELGEYTHNDFSGINSYTPWKSATIELQGCTAFSPGYYSKYSDANAIVGGGVVNVGETNVKNRISMSLSSPNGYISNLKGIISLEAGTNAAKGIGIQIALEKDGVISPVSFNSKQSIELPNAANQVKVPLFARYIQTNAVITAGLAKGAIIYNINYH
ncbi:fimbrial protein [Providencia sp. PROV197]|uniref:fimbrial protein n=1 Tax=Providencia sp. PROV197 TaxID=2949898 RepID=UPI002349F301|nr:fimbrial protein [Providencia sp. PROV197]